MKSRKRKMDIKKLLGISIIILVIAVIGLSISIIKYDKLNKSITQQLNDSYTLGYYDGMSYWNEQVYTFWYDYDSLIYIDSNNKIIPINLLEIYKYK